MEDELAGRPRRRLGAAILVSLLVHVLLGVGLGISWKFPAKVLTPRRGEPLMIDLQNGDDAAPRGNPLAAPAKPPPQPAETPRPTTPPKETPAPSPPAQETRVASLGKPGEDAAAKPGGPAAPNILSALRRGGGGGEGIPGGLHAGRGG